MRRYGLGEISGLPRRCLRHRPHLRLARRRHLRTNTRSIERTRNPSGNIHTPRIGRKLKMPPMISAIPRAIRQRRVAGSGMRRPKINSDFRGSVAKSSEASPGEHAACDDPATGSGSCDGSRPTAPGSRGADSAGRLGSPCPAAIPPCRSIMVVVRTFMCPETSLMCDADGAASRGMPKPAAATSRIPVSRGLPARHDRSMRVFLRRRLANRPSVCYRPCQRVDRVFPDSSVGRAFDC